MTQGKKIGRYSSRRRKSKPNIPGSSLTYILIKYRYSPNNAIMLAQKGNYVLKEVLEMKRTTLVYCL